LKKTLAAVAALTLVGAAAVPAVAGPTEFKLQNKLSSSKAGTKAKPKAVGLNTIITSGPAGDYASSAAVVSLDKNLKFNLKAAKTCAQSVVEADETKCPKDSKVGTGQATAVVAAANNTSSNLDVTAFNGPNNKLFMLVETENPLPVRGVMIGTLKNATGKYGKKLDVKIPQSLQSVAGFTPTLTRFQLNIKKGNYITTTGCTGGKWNFAAVVSYNDGTKGQGTSTVKCS
jgi:hypothetical protein